MTILCSQCGESIYTRRPSPGHEPPVSDLLTIDEAATYLRVTSDRVRTLRTSHDLPATRIGDRAVVRRSDLDIYVAALPSWPSDDGTRMSS